MTAESYILVHIGPVQSWIEQARRTQDLFAGSRLLSYLAANGLQAAQAAGARIVLPAVTGKPRLDANYPNRLMVACVAAQAPEIADAMRAAVLRAWKDLANGVRRYLAHDLRNPDGENGIAFNADIWQRQTDHFLEVYYVFTENTGDYQRDNARLNQLMNSRKALRHIYMLGEPGEKCTLTGEHEALHNAESGKATSRDVRDFWNEVRRRYPNKAEFNNGERLCAISTVKRLAHEALPAFQQDRFPSTSSIACAPFRVALVRKWSNAAVRTAAEGYLQALYDLLETVGSDWRALHFMRSGRIERERLPYIEALVEELGLSWEEDEGLLHRLMSFDGDWFYADTLIDRTVRDYTDADDAVLRTETCQSALRRARERLRDLVSAVGVSPSTYYAILAMDGDDMGDRARRFRDETPHTNFSADLLAFARKTVRPYIEERTAGRLVYSGGDDVLALVPMVDALRIASAIADNFDLNIGSTMSAGIAIVHHTHSLRLALRAARDAEKKAKDVPQKNAFCVEYLRRSGEKRQIVLKWREGEQVAPVVNQLSDMMRAGRLSRQMASEMSEFVYTLTPVVFHNEMDRAQVAVDIPPAMRSDAFLRIFDRRIDPADRNKPELRTLRDQLVTIAESAPDGQNWYAVARLVELARFLSQTEVL